MLIFTHSCSQLALSRFGMVQRSRKNDCMNTRNVDHVHSEELCANGSIACWLSHHHKEFQRICISSSGIR